MVVVVFFFSLFRVFSSIKFFRKLIEQILNKPVISTFLDSQNTRWKTELKTKRNLQINSVNDDEHCCVCAIRYCSKSNILVQSMLCYDCCCFVFVVYQLSYQYQRVNKTVTSQKQEIQLKKF